MENHLGKLHKLLGILDRYYRLGFLQYFSSRMLKKLNKCLPGSKSGITIILAMFTNFIRVEKSPCYYSQLYK